MESEVEEEDKNIESRKTIEIELEPIYAIPVLSTEEKELELKADDVELKPEENMKMQRTNAIEIFQWSNATPIRCHLGRGYACCFCEEQYPKPEDLKKHTIESHDMVQQIVSVVGKATYRLCIKLDITALQCKICKENIDTVELLLEHLKTVHDKIVYTDIKHQILPFKFDNDLLVCFMCQSIFNKFKVLLEHMNVHYRNFNCNKCDTGFVNRRKLQFHMAGHKTGVFTCKQCPKVFNTEIKRKAHEYQVHIDSKRNTCRYCNERFSNARQKEKHIEKVHGNGTL